jgi:hypothetical protein
MEQKRAALQPSHMGALPPSALMSLLQVAHTGPCKGTQATSSAHSCHSCLLIPLIPSRLASKKLSKHTRTCSKYIWLTYMSASMLRGITFTKLQEHEHIRHEESIPLARKEISLCIQILASR